MIMNALKPAAVVARHIVGLMMPNLVFGCLRQVVPDRVPAEGASVLWGIRAFGPWTSPPEHNNIFRVGIVTTGGMGGSVPGHGVGSRARSPWHSAARGFG
jgi:N-methylhydantoinase B